MGQRQANDHNDQQALRGSYRIIIKLNHVLYESNEILLLFLKYNMGDDKRLFLQLLLISIFYTYYCDYSN